MKSLKGFKTVNNEVLIAQESLVQVNREQLEILKGQASQNPRHRIRLCAHKDSNDHLHEMLIVLTKDVYIRPHKHLGKPESFHVIEGSATVIFFDETGRIDEVIQIGDFASGNQFYFRNDDIRYHTQIINSDYLVFHETTKGPFDRNQTVFASWSPEETDVAGSKAYLAKLKAETTPK